LVDVSGDTDAVRILIDTIELECTIPDFEDVTLDSNAQERVLVLCEAARRWLRDIEATLYPNNEPSPHAQAAKHVALPKRPIDTAVGDDLGMVCTVCNGRGHDSDAHRDGRVRS